MNGLNNLMTNQRNYHYNHPNNQSTLSDSNPFKNNFSAMTNRINPTGNENGYALNGNINSLNSNSKIGYPRTLFRYDNCLRKYSTLRWKR